MFKIRAGTVDEIKKDSGDWLFVDVGFSSKDETCGVLKNSEGPCDVKFGYLVKYVIKEAQISGKPLNLLIEAPLSGTFDKDGNPTPRCVDKKDGKTRSWYVQPATTVIVATICLLSQVKDYGIRREVRLFEGFASFKPRSSKPRSSRSSHSEDVMRLRCAAWDPKRKLVVSPSKLKESKSDALQSVCPGIYSGIPPVVMACDKATKRNGVFLCDLQGC